jgi:L-lactate dehydrogenase complex protein LldF
VSRTFLGMPTAPPGVGMLRGERPFPDAARTALADTQLRRNLGKATATIRAKRAAVVAEVPDWAALRQAGAAIKDEVLANLGRYLVQLEEQVTARGGVVHWARDAEEANRVVAGVVRAAGPARWSRSSRWPPRRSASTRPSRRPGSRPGRPTWPS